MKINGDQKLTFSQPSGGSLAKKRLIRGDASLDCTPSSGDVL